LRLIGAGGCFVFRAEDGIRDFHVTGVQTCALPISSIDVTTTDAGSATCPRSASSAARPVSPGGGAGSWRGTTPGAGGGAAPVRKIGRASCRERAERAVVRAHVRKTKRGEVSESDTQ